MLRNWDQLLPTGQFYDENAINLWSDMPCDHRTCPTINRVVWWWPAVWSWCNSHTMPTMVNSQKSTGPFKRSTGPFKGSTRDFGEGNNFFYNFLKFDFSERCLDFLNPPGKSSPSYILNFDFEFHGNNEIRRCLIPNICFFGFSSNRLWSNSWLLESLKEN